MRSLCSSALPGISLPARRETSSSRPKPILAHRKTDLLALAERIPSSRASYGKFSIGARPLDVQAMSFPCAIYATRYC